MADRQMTIDMFLSATELGYTEVPTLQVIWDKAVEIGKEKYPIFDDYSIFRRFVAYMMGFYCDKSMFPHNVKELLLMFIMKIKYNKHWLGGADKRWE